MATCCFFEEVCGSSDETSGRWNGHKGVVASMRKDLRLPPGSDLEHIRKTLRVILKCTENEAKCPGELEMRKEWQHCLMPLDSCNAQLTADLIEDGFGFTETTHFVNVHREEGDRDPVGRSCVCSAVQRMKPTVTMIKRCQQGSSDITSNWAIASHTFSCQILIAQGEPQSKDTCDDLAEKDQPIPVHFDDTEVEKWPLNNAMQFDETHKHQRVGSVKNGKMIEHRFPRGATGKLDLSGGEIRQAGFESHVKCKKEARFMTGCCLDTNPDGSVKKDDDGKPLGKPLPIFECSERKVVSHSKWQRTLDKVKNHPKHLGKKAPWVVSGRVAGVVHSRDDTKCSKGVGKKAKEQLWARKVHTVAELAAHFNNGPSGRNGFRKAAGMGDEKLLQVIAKAESAPVGPPKEIDHRNRENPHFALHKGQWKNKILEHPSMRVIVDVRELVEHMERCGTEQCAGTVHENDWGHCHEALSMMTAKENQEWMQEKGHLEHWRLPQFDLNVHTPRFDRPRCPGNHAGAMSFDDALNKDHDDLVPRMVAAAICLADDDERKFSLRTPKTVSCAHQRVHNNPVVL